MAKSDRKTIDKVFVTLGIVATVTLFIASLLALYAGNFAHNTVRNELQAQKIFFPPKDSPALDPQKFPGLQKYAGQQVDNGPKAKAYANEFIGEHLKAVAGGKTYSEVSTESKANPDDVKLLQQKQTLFQGETLRGILLGDGYAYWTFGSIALYAAYLGFAATAIMAILVLLGLRRIKKSK